MEYVAVLLPSVCLAILFYFVIKVIFNVDRSEREAMARAEELQDARDAEASQANQANQAVPIREENSEENSRENLEKNRDGQDRS